MNEPRDYPQIEPEREPDNCGLICLCVGGLIGFIVGVLFGWWLG